MLLNSLFVYLVGTLDDYKLLGFKQTVELPTLLLSLIFLADCITNFILLGAQDVWH